MRLDLPPAFFLGAYIRLAMLGGLGLFVLGLGAVFAGISVTPPLGSHAPLPVERGPNVYGGAQAIVALLVFAAHWLWLRSAPRTEYDTFLRRAYATIGALAFLAGLALFAPLALARALGGEPATGETIVAVCSFVLAAYFAWRLNGELAS